MAINKNEITKEMLEKAMQCNTAEDLRNMFERADELLYEAKRRGKKNSMGEPYRCIS